MDFIDEVRTRSGRFAKRTEHLDTDGTEVIGEVRWSARTL